MSGLRLLRHTGAILAVQALLSSCADGPADAPISTPDATDGPAPSIAPATIRDVMTRLEVFAIADDGSAILDPVRPARGATVRRKVLAASAEAPPVVALAGDTWGLANRTSATQVTLPARASGRFSLRGGRSNLSVEVALEGASDAPGVAHHDLLTYRHVLDGADLIHRVSDSGTEDFVLYEAPPPRNEFSYQVRLDGQTSLRLVANTLEFLDQSGDPQLRVSPPYLVDATGASREARLSVTGCSVDESPAGPWDRQVTPPGADTCRVTVRWSDQGLSYPILVDPSWGTASALPSARYAHQARRLHNGVVLAAGGYRPSPGYLNDAALFNPVTGTWAATGSMSLPRAYFQMAAFTDAGLLIFPANSDKAYAIGGYNTGGSLSGVEVYDQLSGTWSTTASMATARHVAASAVFGSSSLYGGGFHLVIAGGLSPAGTAASAEVFNGTTWTPAGSMATPRSYVAASRASNQVVFSGGHSGTAALATAERFNTNTGAWTSAGVMPFSTYAHTSTLHFSSGLIYAAGGSNAIQSNRWAQVYDPATNTWASDTFGPLFNGREWHGAAYSNNSVIIMGGIKFLPSGTEYPRETEVRVPNTSGVRCCQTITGVVSCPVACQAQVTPRAFAPAVTLVDGRILYAGGINSSGTATAVSEAFTP